MKRRRLISVLAGTAVGIVLALALWPQGFRQTATLSDGTRLTLARVEAGTNTTFRSGGPFRRLAVNLPVARVRQWSRDAERTIGFGNDTNLALWFTCAPVAPRARQFQFRIVDEFGTNAVLFRDAGPFRLMRSDMVVCYQTPLWPRRSQFLTVQAFADLRPLPDKPQWEFQIRNPAFGDYPQWAPERLPATRTVGDTEFILQELPPAPAGVARPVVEARLRVTSHGQVCDDWSVCGVQFRDATGNRSQTTPGDVTRTGPGRWWVRVPGQLLAGEDAAKIGIGFVRRDNVASNETFVIRGVPVQVAVASSTTARNNEITNPVLGRLIVTALRNHGTGQGWASVTRAEPLVRDITSADARWFLVLGATDDQGRVVTVNNRELDASMGRRLALHPESETLDITVAAARVVFVEWTAGRAQLAAAAAAAR